MKIHLIFIILIVFSFTISCKTKPSKNKDSVNELENNYTTIDTSKIPASSFISYLKEFKYKNQKEFKIAYDSFKKESLNSLKVKDLRTFLNKEDVRKYNDSLLYEHYYYSYQSINKNYEALSLILNTEYKWDLYLITYDFSGNPIDKFSLSSFGGDGDFSFYSYGYFLNDSIYEKTFIEKSFIEDEFGNEQVKMDSILTKHLLKFDGKIELQESYEDGSKY